MISKKQNLDNDEIDLIEIINTIWVNKLKILLITFFALVVMFAYQTTKKNSKQNYLIKTDIRPISNFESLSYEAFNSYVAKMTTQHIKIEDQSNNINYTLLKDKDSKSIDLEKKIVFSVKKIDASLLMKFYLTALNDIYFLREKIIELNFLNPKDYENSKLFEEAVREVASSIKFLAPDTTQKNIYNENWQIEFKTTNVEEWKEFLKKINTISNNRAKKYLESYYEQIFINDENLIKFAIDDTNTRITNALETYEIEISRRIVYLKEQALIARKLGIAKNNVVEAQTFDADTGVISGLTADKPYYIRGYEMIEKEIQLIEGRTDKRAFAEDVGRLEKIKKDLDSNKDTERLRAMLIETPIKKNQQNFIAAKIVYEAPKIDNLDNRTSLKKILIITLIISLLLSIFYVLIITAIQKRN
jgi:LPS O-antigen subunit length determinant protein (WzzB/FepE family)